MPILGTVRNSITSRSSTFCSLFLVQVESSSLGGTRKGTFHATPRFRAVCNAKGRLLCSDARERRPPGIGKCSNAVYFGPNRVTGSNTWVRGGCGRVPKVGKGGVVVRCRNCRSCWRTPSITDSF